MMRFLRIILYKFQRNGKLKDHVTERILDIALFQKQISYYFKNRNLLIQALKHRSYLPFSEEERKASNERLEFLGDAVLSMIVTDYLYNKYPEKNEGTLTKIKSRLVSQKGLVQCSQLIHLGDFILMSPAEESTGGRSRHSILADVLEALIGAIYIDGGYKKALLFIEKFICSQLDTILSDDIHENYKSKLLEYFQSKSWGNPVYEVIDMAGPDHKKVFTIEVHHKNQAIGTGRGRNKKEAEQQAARGALAFLISHESEISDH